MDRVITSILAFVGIIGIAGSLCFTMLKMADNVDLEWWQGLIPICASFMIIFISYIVLDILSRITEYRVRNRRNRRR